MKSKFSYNGSGKGLDTEGSVNEVARNVITFGVYNSSSSHTDNRKNNFLVLSKGPTFGINDSIGATENNLVLRLVKQIFNLDRCVGSYNTLNDLSTKVCVLNKTEDLNLSVFNMIPRINELKTLAKHRSCECKCNFLIENVIQITSGITINVIVCVKIKKKIVYAKNIILGILLHVFLKMVNI